MELQKVLITGASGFLGGIINNKLSNKYDTILFDKRFNKDLKNLLIGDLVEDHELYFQNNFDIVVHCAGKAHTIPKTQQEKDDFYRVNTQGTINLLQALNRCSVKPKAFIFISTVAVYGLSKGEYINEDTSLNATDPYGHSKILAEQAIEDWGKKNDICISILRLPLLIGDNALGNLGAMMKAIQKGYYLGIGQGDAKKSMVLASDIVVAIEQVAYLGGIYNLTDGYHPNFRELEVAISIQMGKPKPFIIPYGLAKLIAYGGSIINTIFKSKKIPLDVSTLEKIINPLTFSDKKAREAFNWHPNRVLDFYK